MFEQIHTVLRFRTVYRMYLVKLYLFETGAWVLPVPRCPPGAEGGWTLKCFYVYSTVPYKIVLVLASPTFPPGNVSAQNYQ